MQGVLFKLFRRSGLVLVAISLAFSLAIMVLTYLRTVYDSSLFATFSFVAPHVTMDLNDGGGANKPMLEEVLARVRTMPEVETASVYTSGKARLKVVSEREYLAGHYRFDGQVEVIGISLKEYPFAIPLYFAQSYNEPGFQSPLTIKELALTLMAQRGKPSVVINEAMAALFNPSPEFIDSYSVLASGAVVPHSRIQVLGAIKDFLDEPRIITELGVAARILRSRNPRGILIRLNDPNRLAPAMAALTGRFGAAFRVRTLNVGQQRHVQFFRIFDTIYWLIVASVLILSFFAALLGVYRAVITKGKSIYTLIILGESTRSIFFGISRINLAAMVLGALGALLLFAGVEGEINAMTVRLIEAVAPIDRIEVDWGQIVLWLTVIFSLQAITFLVAVYFLVRKTSYLQ